MARLDQSFIKAYGHDHAVGPQSDAAPAVESSTSQGNAMFTWTVAASTLDIAAEPSAPVAPHYPRPAQAPAFAPVGPAYPSTAYPSPAPSTPIVIPVATPSRNQSTLHAGNAGVVHRIDVAKPTAAAKVLPVNTTGSVNSPIHVAVKAAPPVATAAPMSDAELADGLCHRSCTIECSAQDTLSMGTVQTHAASCASPAAREMPIANAATAPAWAQRPWQEPTTAAPVAYQEPAAYAEPIAAVPAMELTAGFEVDGFRWPEMVRWFAERSMAALAPLVDELIHASKAGRNVVMLAGGRRGAGATMLTLYAAKRAAELGLRVAIVDGDFSKPSLARSLGVAPTHGWEDVLSRRGDLAQCLITSLGDRVTLLPLRGSCVELAKECAGAAAANLKMLRQHFDLVLVDGGPLADNAEPWLQAAGDGAIDFGIVVRDVRHDSQHGGAHAHRPSAHYPAIGVVENFVRS